MSEVLDETDRLRKRNEQLAWALNDAQQWIVKLRNALQPFAEKHLYPDDAPNAVEIRSDDYWDEWMNDQETDQISVKREWIRRARDAMRGTL